MHRIVSLLKKLYDKKVDAAGLALLRITYFLVLFLEVVQLYSFSPLIYDIVPGIEHYEISMRFVLLLWLIIIVFLILGLYTRLASILNYAFTLFVLSTSEAFEYHVFYTYVSVNFLMMFLSPSLRFSLDAFLIKPKNTQVSVLSYYIPVLLCIGFVYFDSVFYKLSSAFWTKGLGMWLPASLPMATWNNLSFLLNQEFLMKFLGWLIIIFETLFIFVFFLKKARIITFLIGFGLHIGIAIAFPIPWFGLAVTGMYLLLLPISWWKFLEKFTLSDSSFLGRWIKKIPPLSIHYPISEKASFVFVASFICIIFLAQGLITFQSNIFKQIRYKVHFLDTPIDKAICTLEKKTTPLVKNFLGMNYHPVFMDGHFREYQHIIAVTTLQNGKEVWLPMIDQKGMPGKYVTGPEWVNWTFRVVNGKIKDERLSSGLKRYTAFWAFENGIDLKKTTLKLKILCKSIEAPKDWEYDFLNRQINKPWETVGEIQWNEGVFSMQFDNPDVVEHP